MINFDIVIEEKNIILHGIFSKETLIAVRHISQTVVYSRASYTFKISNLCLFFICPKNLTIIGHEKKKITIENELIPKWIDFSLDVIHQSVFIYNSLVYT